MNRKILIIKGHSKNDIELNEDNAYINYYYNFFRSIAGGAYEEDEIICLSEPISNKLKQLVLELKPDYLIIVLLGHGATQDDKQLFQLNSNEIIKAGQLILESSKQLIILESCRTDIKNIFTVDLTDKLPKFKYGGVVKRPLSRIEARQLYTKQLYNCENGIVICFACRKNEEAVNYYFSLAVIQIAFDWHLENGNSTTLSIVSLMNYLEYELPRFTIEQINKIQVPDMKGNINFPIAVSKY